LQEQEQKRQKYENNNNVITKIYLSLTDRRLLTTGRSLMLQIKTSNKITITDAKRYFSRLFADFYQKIVNILRASFVRMRDGPLKHRIHLNYTIL